MFIYSMRAGTLKFFSVIAISLAVLFTLIIFVDPIEAVTTSGEEAEGER